MSLNCQGGSPSEKGGRFRTSDPTVKNKEEDEVSEGYKTKEFLQISSKFHWVPYCLPTISTPNSMVVSGGGGGSPDLQHVTIAVV